MATLQPIRIGTTLFRTYTFWNAVDPDAVPPVADLGSPVDLSPYAIVFKIDDGSSVHSYPEGGGITVAGNIITVSLTDEQTTLLVGNNAAQTYFELTDGSGAVTTRVQRTERIVPGGASS